MKYFLCFIFSMLISFVSVADQRFETVGGFCHFVTPEGFETANDDNEVFFANCENSIRQNADATGSGSTKIKVEYPKGAAPFTGKFEISGNDTNVDCVMVDSNGTTYVTRDWDAEYKANEDKIKYSIICRNGAQQ